MYRGKWATDNIAFGMGAGLIQKLDRDTCEFAFKCSEVTVDGQHRDVFKDPVTDSGKKSKTGRLDLIRMGNTDTLTTGAIRWNQRHHVYSAMQTVYENGILLVDQKFEDIRQRSME